MSVQIIDCVQGSDEWLLLHRGMLTASVIGDALAGGAGKVRTKLMRQLAGEIISGKPRETYQNGAMLRGKAMEAELRTFYQVLDSVEVQQVGFAINDTILPGRTIGCSPDGLVGERGAVEFKTEQPDLLIARWEGETGSGAEHMTQCQSTLWVLERDWIDLGVGYSGMPLWRRRIKRDENRIRQIATGCRQFYDELDALVAKVRRYGT